MLVSVGTPADQFVGSFHELLPPPVGPTQLVVASAQVDAAWAGAAVSGTSALAASRSVVAEMVVRMSPSPPWFVSAATLCQVRVVLTSESGVIFSRCGSPGSWRRPSGHW